MELSYIANESIKWYNHFGKYLTVLLYDIAVWLLGPKRNGCAYTQKKHRNIFILPQKKKKKKSASLDTVGASVSLCFLSIYDSGKCVNILYSGFLSFHCILIPLQYGFSPLFFKEMAQHSELLQFQRFLHVSNSTVWIPSLLHTQNFIL